MDGLNGKNFIKMLESGLANLSNHASQIDELNVFPMPDHDTGSNMTLTFEDGYHEVLRYEADSIGIVAKAFARGLLLGARGDSGVILSQVFRGFYRTIEEKENATVFEIADGFQNGVRLAYKAVSRPAEGTMLTVLREASGTAKNDMVTRNPEMGLREYFARLVRYAGTSLERTREMLPALKAAGVVDSGGLGLLRILEGFQAYLDGRPVSLQNTRRIRTRKAALEKEQEGPGYCTEFFLRPGSEDFREDALMTDLVQAGGESLVVIEDEDLVKVHVHSSSPGEILTIAQRYGEFIMIKVENMEEEHTRLIKESGGTAVGRRKARQYGLITAAPGAGLKEAFLKLQADTVLSGKPTPQSFVDAIMALSHARHILLLPNGEEAMRAAYQAKEALQDMDIHVIGTTSVPEGLSAIRKLDRRAGLADNLKAMQDAIDQVTSACVMHAARDASYGSFQIRKGDYIAIAGDSVIAASGHKAETMRRLLGYLFETRGKSVLTLIAGEDHDPDEMEGFVHYIEEKSDLEVETIVGGQPICSYLIGLS